MSKGPILLGGFVAALVLWATGHPGFAVLAVCAAIWATRWCLPRRPELERLFPTELRRLIHARDGGRCVYCNTRVHYGSDCPTGGCDTCFEADHVEAWADGGRTTLENGVAACRRCNRFKSARPVDEFLYDPDGDGTEGWSR